jgi:hypothetical protein
MPVLDLVSFDEMIRDHCPRPGDRIKQYVVDGRRESRWERETCPSIHIDEHMDNTGLECRNYGPTRWTDLSHDCCDVCCEMQESTKDQSDVETWLAERAQRPPVCSDRSLLSDVIEDYGDIVMAKNPMFAMLRKP